MGWLLEAVVRRVRAMLLADAAGWLEARFLARAAARRAWLLAEADRHKTAGRRDVAAELRRQAGTVSGDRPLATVRAAITDLAADRPGDLTGLPELPALAGRKTASRRGRGR